jgi:hypothetical protein
MNKINMLYKICSAKPLDASAVRAGLRRGGCTIAKQLIVR